MPFEEAAAWAWENFGKEWITKLKDEAKQKWAEYNWAGASDRYRGHLIEAYSTLRILGKPEPVPLDNIFTDVYILDKPAAYRRYDITQLHEDPERLHQDVKRLVGEKVVKNPENKRLFILGKPGAGKTTFLKYLTIQAAYGFIEKIPVFISLKDWSDAQLDLMPFLVKQFELCEFPDAQLFIEHILKTGQAMVLFDGLDEVNTQGAQRQQVIDQLKAFHFRYLNTQSIITCRIAATQYEFDRFTYMEVADFTEEQMETFVRKWFKDDPTKQKAFLTEIGRSEHQGLQDLGRSPLLLSLLCLNFEATMSFPQRRVEIYEEALEALLKKWDISRSIKRDEAYHALSLGRKRQLFSRIAFATFERGEYFLPQSQLVKSIVDYLRQLPPTDSSDDIDGEAVLKAIECQHGILVERARQIYAFAHLTFQEYFTAKYLVDNAHQGTLDAAVRNHVGDPRWREVFVLTASLLDNADGFFNTFRQAIDDLVVKEKTLVNYLAWATRKAATVQTPYRSSAVRSFYCYSGRLDRDLALARDLDRALALAHDLDLAPDLALARDLARDLALAHDLDLALALAVDLARARVRVLARDLDRDLRLDLLLTITGQLSLIFGLVDNIGFKDVKQYIPQFTEYWEYIIKVNREVGLSDLTQALEQLSVPTSQDRQAQWQIFIKNFHTLIQTHRDIGYDWSLTARQVECLETYLSANRLLVECLNVAVVTDREQIKNDLLLPPPSIFPNA